MVYCFHTPRGRVKITAPYHVSHTMTMIHYEACDNRLCFNINLLEKHPSLNVFIRHTNRLMPGTYEVDWINGKVWFYPPYKYGAADAFISVKEKHHA